LNTTDSYTIKYPLEVFEEWLEERAMEDGIFYGNGRISITNITFDDVNAYVIIEGEILRRMDS
jgi:hypothetical protein